MVPASSSLAARTHHGIGGGIKRILDSAAMGGWATPPATTDAALWSILFMECRCHPLLADTKVWRLLLRSKPSYRSALPGGIKVFA
jgi:hypothetical protein